MTNPYTILYFLLKLVEYLDCKDKHWRSNLVILLDNAKYHKSKLMIELYQRINLPVKFLRPYHYKMAPIEIFFSYIKNRYLNIIKTRNVKE